MTGTDLPGPPRRVALVLGTTAGGTGAHVRMLAAGLAERGISVSVLGPSSADARFSFSALPWVTFTAVKIGEQPRPGDFATIARLRRLLASLGRADGPDAGSAGAAGPDGQGGGADVVPEVVHAHGLRAGAMTVLALRGIHGARRPAVVVTLHNAPPAGRGALVWRLLLRVVARGASGVLCVSPDLEQRARAAGARRIGRAVVAAPDAGTSFPGAPGIAPLGRPIVLAAGRLAPQKGFGVLLDAATSWRRLDPVPLVVIAGDGPLATSLRARAAELGIDALFPGHIDDLAGLLAAAAVFVLPSQWEGQPLVLQEALRAGTAIVASAVGGVPDLTGADAALLVRPGDSRVLAAAVIAVLTDETLAAQLRAAAAERAATLPSAADATAAALRAYGEAR